MYRKLAYALAFQVSSLAAAAPVSNSTTYVVSRGDTMYSVAKRYGLSVDQLLSLNNLSASNLEVGQVLTVVAPTYQVLKGDTIYSIARRNGLSIEELLNFNSGSTNRLDVGQILNLSAVPAPVTRLAPTVAPVLANLPVFANPVSGNVSRYAAPKVAIKPKLNVAALNTTIKVVPAVVPQAPLASSLPANTVFASSPVSNPVTDTAYADTAPATASQPAPTESALVVNNPVSNAANAITNNTANNILPTNADWLSNAQSLLGVPYVWGANNRRGTDCSGFVMQVFGPLGLNLPRTSAAQSKVGQSVGRQQLQRGDLVFFDTEGRGRVTHVGISLGGNTFINANSYLGRVAVDDLSSRYWASRYVGARRVLGVMAVANASALH